MRFGLLAAMLAMGLSGTVGSQIQPLLQLQGQPYFGGSMKLHLTGTVGQPALLAYGLNPLPPEQPLQTGKGAWYIGGLLNLVALGNVPASGRIDMPFMMPPLMPALTGIPIVMQGYVPFTLSNPTVLSLDQPYYAATDAQILVSPDPAPAGLFGDRVETGDLNGDGHLDIVVGAWFEDASGVDMAGKAHVFWGPTLIGVTTLEPPAPHYFGLFGQGLAIGDFDGDLIDDLAVSEGNGDPPPATEPGHLYVYYGSSTFPTSPDAVSSSIDQGFAYQSFGHKSIVADFTADGSPDLAIGLPTYTVQGLTKAGRVEIYPGPALAGGPFLVAPDLGQDGFFGDRLASADVNGDFAADLIVGAPRKDVGGIPSMGRVYVFAAPAFTHLKTIAHPDPSGLNSRFGNAVVGRDMNGDGLADVIATDQRNHAYIFWAPNFDTFARITRPPDSVTGTSTSISFGYFAAAGDVNDDGMSDVVIAEPFGAGVGRVYISLGPYFASFLVLQDQSPSAGSEFGWGVYLRNLDADGRPELIVGSDLSDPGGISGAGHVTVFHTN